MRVPVLVLSVLLLLAPPAVSTARAQGSIPPTEVLGPGVATGINDLGVIVGVSPGAVRNREVAWVREGGERAILPTLGGRAQPRAVNLAGEVVGSSETADGRQRAVLWSDGEVRDLGTLGGDTSEALDINQDGDVVGWSTDAQGRVRAFRWADGRMTDLPGLGGTTSAAHAINRHGDVVGEAKRADGRTVPALWRADGATDLSQHLPTDPEDPLWSATAYDVNDAGQIVVALSGEQLSAYTLMELGAAGAVRLEPTGYAQNPRAINGAGWAVGCGSDEGFDCHGAAWSPTGTLTGLAGIPHPDWGTQGGSAALDVNSRGQAVGWAYDVVADGSGSSGWEQRAVVWDVPDAAEPTPEPTPGPTDPNPSPGPAPTVVTHGSSARLSGSDRFATAAAAALRLWPDGAPTVVVATGFDYPDALAGGPYAAVRDAPLLLATTHGLPPVVADALVDLEPEEVVLLGGPGALSEHVAAAVRALPGAPRVTRLAGGNRFETAERIAAAAGRTGDGEVAVATGFDFPDAVAVGALAAGESPVPVTLSTRDRLTSPLQAGERALLVGGTGVLSGALEEAARRQAREVVRLAGSQRFATSQAVADHALARLQGQVPLVVATGHDFPDALAAGPVAARTGGPLLLIPTRGPTHDQATWVHANRARFTGVIAVGGGSAVSDEATSLVRAALQGAVPDPRP